MNQLRFAAIVEGHGEAQAVPILIRRVLAATHPTCGVDIPLVLPVPAAALRKQDELERHVERAARKLRGRGAILILVDCDWQGCCPAEEGPSLLQRARRVRQDTPVGVVLAKQEYEAWLIAAAESLRGMRRLRLDMTAPHDPESIRGAKEWLSAQMPSSAPYVETIDQPALTNHFDMDIARRRSDSFAKCYREIVTLASLQLP